ncbi:MAG: porin [Chitinophagales bacterium]|nr:porin [Chitinophagales bacterium]
MASAKADSTLLARQNEWQGQLESSVYIEAYYQYDFNKPANGLRPAFVYSFHRNNIPSINLAMVKLNYNSMRFRANAAAMGGTYSMANMANEPIYLRNIFEANFGFKLLKQKQLWLDAGVLPSHIGFESATGKDCPTLTRSVLADNSPYFETGLKMSYTTDNEKLLVSILVLNGWQRIKWINGNTLPSFGWQVQGKPNSKLLINSSGFIGTDKADAEKKLRYFHNLYLTYSPTEKFTSTLGFDLGVEQQTKNSKVYSLWYSPAIIARYLPLKQLAIAARAEYYSDKHGVIVSAVSPKGFQTLGYSLNIDALPTNDMIFRVEGKLLQSVSGKNFETTNGTYTTLSPSIAISFCYSFTHKFFQ